MSRRVFTSPQSESIARSIQKTLLLSACSGFTRSECLFLLEIANLTPPTVHSLETLRTCAAEIVSSEKVDPLKLEFEGI